jgi:hypothetical protein
MDMTGIVGAFVAAVLGAVVWCGIMYFVGYEHALIAWGIGAAVGGTAYALGGEGVGMGAVCAGLTLFSILTGKMFAYQIMLDKEVDYIVENELTQEVYNMWVTDATDFAGVEESGYKAYMVSHEYTSAGSAAAVPDEEYAYFVEYSVPQLQSMQQRQPTFDQWYEEAEEELEESIPSPGALIREDLDLFDGLFALLGIATAFKVGSQGNDAD